MEKVTDVGACEEVEMLSGGGGLSKYMMANGGSDDGEGELDEQDLKDDPIYNLDLRVSSLFPPLLSEDIGLTSDFVWWIQTHLAGFFRHAYEEDLNEFRGIAERYLTNEEKAVLTHMLQSA